MNRPDRLAVDIVELRRHTGGRREVKAELALDDLGVGESWIVDGALDVDLVIEAVTDGVVAYGRIAATSRTPCRRCLNDVDLALEADIHEVFESDPTQGETWPIEDERIDLTPMLREAAILGLPVAPLCARDCAGPEPERFPTGPPPEDDPSPVRDERWAALDDLTFDE